MDTSWSVLQQITWCLSGMFWVEIVIRDSASPPPSSKCNTIPETRKPHPFFIMSLVLCTDHALLSRWCKLCVLETRCWCVQWSRLRYSSRFQTPNTWSYRLTMTRTWTWWHPLTEEESLFIQEMLRARSDHATNTLIRATYNLVFLTHTLTSFSSDRFWCWTQTLRTWSHRSEWPQAPATPLQSNPSSSHGRAGESIMCPYSHKRTLELWPYLQCNELSSQVSRTVVVVSVSFE